METIILKQDSDPLPKKKKDALMIYNYGILNSNYKEETRQNLFKSHPKSIFGVRQRIKNSQYQFVSGAAVILKVSVFVLAYITIFS